MFQSTAPVVAHRVLAGKERRIVRCGNAPDCLFPLYLAGCCMTQVR